MSCNLKNSKEYHDVLFSIKHIINKSDFVVNKDMLSKEYIKSIIVNNPDILAILRKIKEKTKSSEKQKNIFSLISMFNKKNFKEEKIILANLTNFSFFYNEPEYIKLFNHQLYSRILQIINDMSKLGVNYISVLNG
jgi:hypothetical protein